MQSKEYWDKYYQDSPFLTGKAPLKFLVDMFPRLQKGKVLDIGMGEGANAVYLAQKGMTVKGVDVSTVAVERANQLARDTGVSIEAKATDLDLFLMGLMEYDSIIMTFFKPSVSRYYSEIIRALKQGGMLLVHSYMIEEMKVPMAAEDYRNFYFHTNELLRGLQGLQIFYYNESEIDGKSCVQCLARKPLDKDAAKYNLFNMQSAQEKPKSTQRDLAETLFKKK
ncbi:MAG: class I SAM-dependent methyltransferase [Pseudomonadota bacterium]|nr:class I SAM-dependent methyltransferase [Pseudomonadota bacterium]